MQPHSSCSYEMDRQRSVASRQACVRTTGAGVTPLLLRVGTDFSGIETPLMALNHLGIPFVQTFASENDAVLRHFHEQNFKPLVLLPDATVPIAANLSPDIYVAGPPCQPFSSAGRRLGLADPRSLRLRAFVERVRVCS